MISHPGTTESFRRRFGELVRIRRKSRGLESKKLAAELGLAPQMISEYERGRTLPSAWTLVLLMTRLKISAADMLKCGQSDGIQELRETMAVRKVNKTRLAAGSRTSPLTNKESRKAAAGE